MRITACAVSLNVEDVLASARAAPDCRPYPHLRTKEAVK
jgi:hypothetical protein